LRIPLPYKGTAILCGIPNSKSRDLLVLDDDLLYNEFIKALERIANLLDIALIGGNPSEWRGVKLSADAPIEASSFEGV
jgi:hypothetical protein